MPNINVPLRNTIIEHFDLDELRDLCFELDVTFDDLAGDTLSEKARELVLFLDRRGDTAVLIDVCRRLRPKAHWPKPAPPTPSPPADEAPVARRSPSTSGDVPATTAREPANSRAKAEAAPRSDPLPSAPAPWLEVTRTPNVWAYSARSFGVFVDGVKVADVRSGATVRAALKPGRHKLQVRIDLIKSNVLEFDAADGGTARAQVDYALDSLLGSLKLSWIT